MRFALDKNFFNSNYCMSLTLELVNNPAIKNLIQSSLESENKGLRLKWIPNSEITDIKSTQIDNVYHASHKQTYDGGYVNEMVVMLLSLGNAEECTPTFVSEFARIYSLPTHKYNNDESQFRRYKKWLENRNELIKG